MNQAWLGRKFCVQLYKWFYHLHVHLILQLEKCPAVPPRLHTESRSQHPAKELCTRLRLQHRQPILVGPIHQFTGGRSNKGKARCPKHSPLIFWFPKVEVTPPSSHFLNIIHCKPSIFGYPKLVDSFRTSHDWFINSASFNWGLVHHVGPWGDEHEHVLTTQQNEHITDHLRNRFIGGTYHI